MYAKIMYFRLCQYEDGRLLPMFERSRLDARPNCMFKFGRNRNRKIETPKVS